MLSRNKSDLFESTSNVENEVKRPMNLYNQYNKMVNDKIKAREEKTKLVSKSFVNVRENVKDMLRQSIEKEKCFLHKENNDFKKEKATTRLIEREKVQQKLNKYITKPKSKVDEYYEKYVK